jgi:transaldolase
MTALSIFDQLTAANPKTEIWWDSSPLMFAPWSESAIAAASPADTDSVASWLRHLFNPGDAHGTLFKGATNNPRLCLEAINGNLPLWSRYVQSCIETNPQAGVEEIFWRAYRELARRGAEMMMPQWLASEKKFGFVSCQVDPRYAFDYERMLEQALALHALSPNIMIKCPGSREGCRLVNELTGRGIPTNSTLSFSVPQYVACMKAVVSGLEIAKKRGLDLSGWRAVITHMSSRFERLGDLVPQAQARNIALSPEEITWASIAVFKRAYRIAQGARFPGKLLISSMRVGPRPASCWHIEQCAGADAIFTCPPPFIAELMRLDATGIILDPRAIEADPPGAVLDKLMRIPYFEASYEPDGMKPEQFNHYAPLAATMAEFIAATNGMVDFVARCMNPT